MDFVSAQMNKLNAKTNTAELKGCIEKAYKDLNLGENCRVFNPVSVEGKIAYGDYLTKLGWKKGTLEFNSEKQAQRFNNGLKAVHQKSGIIVANIEKRGLSVFHEFGHEMFQKNSIGKILNKLQIKSNQKLYWLLPVVAFLIPGHKNNEKNHGFMSKTVDFVKQNAATITLALYSPKLIEEALASIKGNKLAKKFCTESMYKNVVKNNHIGFLSYAFKAAGLTLCSYFASKFNNKD